MISWWFIFRKLFVVRNAVRRTDQFERSFWSGADLGTLYQSAANSRHDAGSMERIFESGFREFVKLRKQTGTSLGMLMDGTRRAMRATYQRELDHLESHLSFLATVGSVSPYVGLFGTVWGIMNAFRGLANVGQATLAHVAPGIAAGLEFYDSFGKLAHTLPGREQDQTLYLTLDVDRKPLMFNIGVGRGLNGATDHWTLKAIIEVPFD